MRAADADLVILGGGCAGLSLAARLAEAEAGGAPVPRVIVIEPRPAYTDDRTWSFWNARTHDFEAEIEARWWRWRFSTDREAHIGGSGRYCYQTLPAAAFYRRCRDRIDTSRRINLHMGVAAREVCDRRRSVRIETTSGPIDTPAVIDTRPPPLPPQAPPPGLVQAFRGVRVITASPRFDPATVGLMDAMAVDAWGFRFTYTLPYSDCEALVEVTRFSPVAPPVSVLEADLETALCRAGVGKTAAIVRREHGAIPMGVPSPPPTSPRIVPAGTRGGAVRPASGYAFLRIDAWARHTARRLIDGLPPALPPPEPPVRAFMDRVFLTTLRRQPEIAPMVFVALGRPALSDRLVRFLSDTGTAADALAIIAALPAAPFLRSAAESLWTPRRLPRAGPVREAPQ